MSLEEFAYAFLGPLPVEADWRKRALAGLHRRGSQPTGRGL